jgi:hypothetical protein
MINEEKLITMKKLMLSTALILVANVSFGQDTTIATVKDTSALVKPSQLRGNERIFNKGKGKLKLGGYAEVDYNQGVSQQSNGKLDVHRLVMFMGYQFNKKTQFISELEFEHVKEIYVEQAFLRHKINSWINFNAGLMLVPMNYINEYHEPTFFFSVERPSLDNKVVPTTWREIGAGFSGNIKPAKLKYQLYIMNGFNGYSGGKTKFKGSNGFRSGRQKGAESFASSPTLAAKLNFYGVRGLKIGAAYYGGKSQSELFDGLNKSDVAGNTTADSSVVGISTLGIDMQYNKKGFIFRGQLNHVAISNTEQYNTLGGTNLGSEMFGYYAEAGFDVFSLSKKAKGGLIPFVRFEQYNTHQTVYSSTIHNDAYNVMEIIAGVNWKLAKGAVLKLDYQMVQNQANAGNWTNFINAGVGFNLQ